MNCQLLHGDCREVLKTLPDESVHCCVTSPPYFGLRDYGTAKWEGGDSECDHRQPLGGEGSTSANTSTGTQTHQYRGVCGKCGATRIDSQIGLEPTPDAYVAELVAVFREVRRVLREDGTLWLNLGDSYSSGGRTTTTVQTVRGDCSEEAKRATNSRPPVIEGIKPKDLIGIPWMVAFALRADGWYLRQDIIWHKPNPMPESVTDRCTKAHEYVFLLSKSEKYYYDAEAIKEPVTQSSIERLSQPNLENQAGSDRVPGKTNGPMKAVRSKANSFKREGSKREQAIPGQTVGTHRPDLAESEYSLETRNKRSVWTVSTRPYKEAHFATFPPALITPMIMAGCPTGGTVLDPFGGAMTTMVVCQDLGRSGIAIELNTKYIEIGTARVRNRTPGFSFA